MWPDRKINDAVCNISKLMGVILRHCEGKIMECNAGGRLGKFLFSIGPKSYIQLEHFEVTLIYLHDFIALNSYSR